MFHNFPFKPENMIDIVWSVFILFASLIGAGGIVKIYRERSRNKKDLVNQLLHRIGELETRVDTITKEKDEKIMLLYNELSEVKVLNAQLQSKIDNMLYIIEKNMDGEIDHLIHKIKNLDHENDGPNSNISGQMF